MSEIDNLKDKLFYFGNFDTWKEAVAACAEYGAGYESDLIFEKVKNAIQSVRNGEGAYEQDGVVFKKLLINYELLSSLLFVCAKDGYLNLIDFGGSLGSTFFRYRQVFAKLPVEWTVVEQKHFVDYGRLNVPEVKFKYELKECDEGYNAVLLSSVLSYVENPYDILTEIAQKKIKYIIIDEQAFSNEDADMIHLQNVPKSIYEAVYPVRLFSITKLKEFFLKSGYKVWEWDYKFGNIPVYKNGCFTDTIEKGMFVCLA